VVLGQDHGRFSLLKNYQFLYGEAKRARSIAELTLLETHKKMGLK